MRPYGSDHPGDDLCWVSRQIKRRQLRRERVRARRAAKVACQV